MKVEIYSDIACPWCYVGKKRFERALAAFPGGSSVEVVYRPYQLDPNAPEEPVPHREALAAKFGPRAAEMDARLAELGEAEGLAFDFDAAIENNSLLAHRLLWLALNEYGADAQAALKDRLLTAHFAEGMDIGDRSHLVEAAVGIGLDRDRVLEFLDGDEARDEVEEEIDEARARGITAVPTFVFEGQWAVQGAQEASTFLKVLEQVSAESSAASPKTDGGEACADGSCEV